MQATAAINTEFTDSYSERAETFTNHKCIS